VDGRVRGSRVFGIPRSERRSASIYRRANYLLITIARTRLPLEPFPATEPPREFLRPFSGQDSISPDRTAFGRRFDRHFFQLLRGISNAEGAPGLVMPAYASSFTDLEVARLAAYLLPVTRDLFRSLGRE
jgi:hypothetical protein